MRGEDFSKRGSRNDAGEIKHGGRPPGDSGSRLPLFPEAKNLKFTRRRTPDSQLKELHNAISLLIADHREYACSDVTM